MAPQNGSVKARRPQVPSSKQMPKPVVPAIPLPYVKRQAAAAAAAAPVTAADANANASSEDSAHNGSLEVRAPEMNQASSPTLIADTPHASESLSAGSPDFKSAAKSGLHEAFDSTKEVVIASSKPVARPNQATGKNKGSTNHTVLPTNVQEASAPQVAQEASSNMQTQFHGSAMNAGQEEHRQRPAQYLPVKLASSQPPPPVSPTRYQMPPPFQPSHRPMGIVPSGDMSHGPRPPLPNGPSHMHQAHASNGSIHFGAFHDSQSSSPAPPHSGGIAPPPGMPMPDGRPHPMMPPNGNGFPPMVPYGADMMPVANFDGYGRPMPYAPMDSYPPYGNNLGPSTPHSYHDSQSSAHQEETAMYNQYRPGAMPNGVAVGPNDEAQGQNHQGRMYGLPDYPRMMPTPGLPPHMAQGDNADGFIGYLQQQFASPELADCTLELRYTDDRAAPVRIPGHRLVFARSLQLYNLLQKQNFQASPNDRALQTILLETGSKWIRSDSFYMAVQRLYGLPLLHAPPPRRVGMEPGDVTAAGSVNEQLDFAISYAAAGHLLDWTPVVRRGCEVATHLLTWETLERVLEFALEGYRDKGSHEIYQYGNGSQVLLNAVVTFLVHNFPSHFNLDTEATEFVPYSRLPISPPPPAKDSLDNDMLSASADGSSVQLGKGRRPQKLNGIQFGDLAFTEGKNPADANTPKATRAAQPASFSILSRILVEIPFTQLKMILESSGSGNVNGWANAESRYRIIKLAVEERESRRRCVLDAVLSGRVADAEAIRAGLCSPEPRDLGWWTALGWQEEMLPYGNPDGPTLARKWVPLMEAQNGPMSNVTEYP
ncbi:hypothetical protein BBK36DRAFT_1113846 [Trichoderma citrinoviride]|uniref:BTB domain-containing protein n=1 Tax=Trichoderma citrinoviride TaxID=58853 RepID=A0A2T4BIR3_9HYPO|nr:hypothetical protein BBK36DRAFT_1113846 [Trichoderma citrinoviride]PTB69161.1 hypothetical protein BBK36DRAFT_1113846 [Trichoderma citrinoviride]